MFCEMVRTIFQSLTADVFQSHGKTLAWAAQKRCYMIILGIRVSWECRFQASGQCAVLVVGMDPCRPGHRIAHGDAVHNFFSHPGTWSWSGPTPLVTKSRVVSALWSVPRTRLLLDLDNKLLIVSCSLFLALCGAIGEATLPSFFNRTAMPRLCHNP